MTRSTAGAGGTLVLSVELAPRNKRGSSCGDLGETIVLLELSVGEVEATRISFGEACLEAGLELAFGDVDLDG